MFSRLESLEISGDLLEESSEVSESPEESSDDGGRCTHPEKMWQDSGTL